MSDKSITYSYTAGTVAGGLLQAYKLSNDVKFLMLAHNISQAAIKYLTKELVKRETFNS